MKIVVPKRRLVDVKNVMHCSVDKNPPPLPSYLFTLDDFWAVWCLCRMTADLTRPLQLCPVSLGYTVANHEILCVSVSLVSAGNSEECSALLMNMLCEL